MSAQDPFAPVLDEFAMAEACREHDLLFNYPVAGPHVEDHDDHKDHEDDEALDWLNESGEAAPLLEDSAGRIDLNDVRDVARVRLARVKALREVLADDKIHRISRFRLSTVALRKIRKAQKTVTPILNNLKAMARKMNEATQERINFLKQSLRRERTGRRRSPRTTRHAAAMIAAGTKALRERAARRGPATEPTSPAAEASWPARERSDGATRWAK